MGVGGRRARRAHCTAKNGSARCPRTAGAGAVAAHTRERRFAPLSCFMAGVAAERIRIANPALNDGVIADYIRAVRKELERDVAEEPGR